MSANWEYRVVKKIYPDQKEEDGTIRLEIHEVYKLKDKKGKRIIDMTEEIVPVSGYSIKQLKEQLKSMEKALKKPPLILRVPHLEEDK